MSDNYEEYFVYLQQRSRIGYLYRNYILYPKLSAYLNGKVLDIGCGIGDFLQYRKDSTGVDVNPETVKYCQQQRLDVRVMEIDHLPFESSTFDGLLMDNVLEHIEEPEPILKEVRRVLVEGGKFLVGVPGSKGYASDPDHKVFYSKEKLTAMMSKAGFIEEIVFSMPLGFDWLDDKISQYCIYGVFVKK
jgi:SAM-dependent methyltransferase